MSAKQEKRIRRHKKIRQNIHGSAQRPRLCVFRSNQHIYAQLINDDTAKVLAQVSDADLKLKKAGKKSDTAKEVGILIAKKAIEKKIEKVIFDRGGIVFHGRVKALADGAREGGLKF
ncbi:MAG: 50S ribosomal protein L18 [Candidatus Staskawiczbacteria bacterium]|nr:50S ribosomal protein L18 [Candidatus Staskawiczbacteria bacterium]